MLVLIGSGGHAKVVLDAAFAAGVAETDVRVFDGNAARCGADFLGLRIEGPDLDASICGAEVHVAIGSSQAHERLYREAEVLGAQACTVLHPQARVSRLAVLSPGVFAAAGAVIAIDAAVGRGTIVNHNAVIDHDCRIGDCCHVAPGAVLGGGVIIGAGVLVGAGAVILPGVEVGENATIGAGAVVTRTVGAGETWTGVPARGRSDRQAID